MKWKITLLLFLIVGTIWILIGRSNKKMYENTGTIFGTVYHIKYEHTMELHEEIRKSLHEVDTTFSLFKEESELSRFNRNEVKKYSKVFISLTNLALNIAKETGGAFDPTVAPLINAWGFGFKKGELPTTQQVDSLHRLIGYEKIKVQDDKIEKIEPFVQLDFGAIAKGFAVDCVARLLDKAGVINYMIEIGGEVVVRGRKPNGEKWHIGIATPSENTEDMQTVVALTDCAMATSGNYRNFYIKDGKKYAHTINPQTGYPVEHNLLSATVIASSCAEADAYATAFMVMGREKAEKLLEKHKKLKAYFIYMDTQGKLSTWQSERFPKSQN